MRRCPLWSFRRSTKGRYDGSKGKRTRQCGGALVGGCTRYHESIATSRNGDARIPMTASGFEALKAELGELRARRPAMVEEVAAARSQGDLSENFAYHDARQHLGMLDGRVQTIEATLARAQVVQESDAKGVARIGSTVVV